MDCERTVDVFFDFAVDKLRTEVQLCNTCLIIRGTCDLHNLLKLLSLLMSSVYLQNTMNFNLVYVVAW